MENIKRWYVPMCRGLRQFPRGLKLKIRRLPQFLYSVSQLSAVTIHHSICISTTKDWKPRQIQNIETRYQLETNNGWESRMGKRGVQIAIHEHEREVDDQGWRRRLRGRHARGTRTQALYLQVCYALYEKRMSLLTWLSLGITRTHRSQLMLPV